MLYKQNFISKKPNFLKTITNKSFSIYISFDLNIETISVEEYFINKNNTLFEVKISLDVNDKGGTFKDFLIKYFYPNKNPFIKGIKIGDKFPFKLEQISEIVFEDNAAIIYIECENPESNINII